MKHFQVTLLLSFSLQLCFAVDYELLVNQRPEVVESRQKAIEWILSVRKDNWGWGTNDFPETHRVLTTLVLSNKNYTDDENVECVNTTRSLEYQLSLKQMDLELTLALLHSRHDHKAISAGQLALYANALIGNCRDVRNFYGYNIASKMKRKKRISTYEDALVSLSMCISGHRLSKRELQHYIEIVDNNNSSSDTHGTDTKAMIILALACAKESHQQYHFIQSYLRRTLKLFKKMQTPEGSFGNIYTSGLVIQALIASGDKGIDWDFDKAVDYLLLQQNKDGSFSDLLASYFALPVLSGHTLLDLKNVICKKHIDETDNEIVKNVTEVLIQVRYSVWSKTNISEVFDVPQNSTFLDVMNIAQKLDGRYRYTADKFTMGYLVKSIGGISDSSKCNRYWILHKFNNETSTLDMVSNGISKVYPEDGDHYVFWLKTFPPVKLSDGRENSCIDEE